MNLKTIYNFWINTKPFRSIWILPLVFTGLIIILFIYYSDSKKMQCTWEARDRWECARPTENS